MPATLAPGGRRCRRISRRRASAIARSTCVDELNNQGLRKRLLGEVDVFQFDHTHELYAHMNINYIKLDRLPAFDRWGDALAPLAKGEFFTTTGEVLLPDVDLRVIVRRPRSWRTFARSGRSRFGSPRSSGATARRRIARSSSWRRRASSAARRFEWRAKANGWKWARVAVWDVAGNGAFVNPFWRP